MIVGSTAAISVFARFPRDQDWILRPADHDALLKFYRGSTLAVYPLSADKTFLLVGRRDISPPRETIIEIEIAYPGSSGEMLLQYEEARQGLDPRIQWDPGIEASPKASLNSLLMLKLSHRYLKNSPHFLKTMRDIQALRRAGAMLDDELKAILKVREKETYTYQHPKLNVSKDDFFRKDDGVEYVYDHDTVHLAMKHLDRPAYEYFKEPGAEVKCSRKLFEAADEKTRLYSVVEEAYVLAIERSQVPFRGKKTPRWSFLKAMEKVCTSITSGWWREYAWEHYDQVLAMYDPGYADRFWAAVDAGVVRKL